MGVQIIGQPACTEHLRDGRMKFVRDYTIVLDWHAGVARVTIKEGMVTDGSSIPILLRWLLPKDRTRQAGFVHDKLYAEPVVDTKLAASWDSPVPIKTVRLKKSACDVIWGHVANEGERRASLPLPLCWLGVLGLWCFGWFAWWTWRKREDERTRRAGERNSDPAGG
jgi:hypothetical protein